MKGRGPETGEMIKEAYHLMKLKLRSICEMELNLNV